VAVPKMELYEDAREILARVLKISAKQIQAESTLQDDLGIDSVDFWDVVASFDKKYGVRISVQEAASLRTVADLIGAIEKKIRVRQKDTS